MRRISGLLLMAGMMLAGPSPGEAWSTASGLQSASDHGGGQQTSASVDTDRRTEKQKALATQAERLFNMATELKAQVDLTNKNILSLKVVEKAEEIEALAKGMRGQAKK